MYYYHAFVTRVVDGDTLDLAIDLGFKVKINIRARLLGVDTPEVYGVKKTSEEYQKGKAASEFVVEWLETINNKVYVRTHKDSQGKYGRYLVEIINPETSETLNEALISSGHGTEVLYG